MLWQKAWLETRWRFLIGLGILTLMSAKVIFTQSLVARFTTDTPEVPGRLGEILKQAMGLMSSYHGYVWSQWFSSNLPQFWVLFAILIGVGGIVLESGRGAALFTLSLPVTRRRLLAVRAAVGLIEIAILGLVPSVLIPLLSPIMGKSYAIKDTLLYSLLSILAGAVFFSFSFFLSSIFSDQIKTIMMGISLALVLAIAAIAFKGLARYSVFRIMSGETYFYDGVVPWLGLAVCLGISALFFFLSVRAVELRDF